MSDSAPQDQDHISTVRRHLLDQLKALRTAPRDEQLSIEIKRAKAVGEVAQTIINAARVEVDYIHAVRGASDSSFLQAPDEGTVPKRPVTPQSPLPTADDPVRLGGPAENHPWRATTNKLGR